MYIFAFKSILIRVCLVNPTNQSSFGDVLTWGMKTTIVWWQKTWKDYYNERGFGNWFQTLKYRVPIYFDNLKNNRFKIILIIIFSVYIFAFKSILIMVCFVNPTYRSTFRDVLPWEIDRHSLMTKNMTDYYDESGFWYWFQKLKYRVHTYFDILKNNRFTMILTKDLFCVYFRIKDDSYLWIILNMLKDILCMNWFDGATKGLSP